MLRSWPAGLLLAVSLVSGCAGGSGAGSSATPAGATAQPLQIELATSEVVAGQPQRVAFGVVNPAGAPVAGVTVTIQVIDTAAKPQAPLGPALSAPYRGELLEGKGLYALTVSFPHPGTYVGSAELRLGSVHVTAEVPIQVLAQGTTPAVGSPAPRSQNPVAADVSDIALIDSGKPPNDMHYTSIAAAIAAHHALLVYFGSPGYCPTQTCGPELHVVQHLESIYRPRGVDFVHIETYRDGKPGPTSATSATFDEWHLGTDPWVFVVGADGLIAAKFEGPTAPSEIAPAIDGVLKPA